MIFDMFTAFLGFDLGYWTTLLYGFLFFTFGLTAYFILGGDEKFKFKNYLKEWGLIYAFVAFLLVMGWEFFSENYFVWFIFFQFGLMIWGNYHKNLNKYALFILMIFFAGMSWLVTAYPGILY